MLCCKKQTQKSHDVQGYVNPVDEGGWISTPPQKGGSENQHVHPMYPTPRPLKVTIKDITNVAARNSAFKPAKFVQKLVINIKHNECHNRPIQLHG